jgi:glycosidase
MATVIYQIFVDRFASAKVGAPGLRAWDLPPEEPPRGRDVYGGDLDGIIARLDHVQRVGADAIYLTPIFAAPSNHKYDTADFEHVDAGFGGDAAFERLVAATRARGLGLILDGVFNHVGEEHPWARDPSRLRGTAWRGFSSLPELDLGKPRVRDDFFGADGVMARWTRRGATGWRLDCANDLGHDGCALAAAAGRAAGAADGVIGEVMAYPAGWAGPHLLDGVMNYWLRSSALALASASPASQVQYALDRLAAEMPKDALRKSWNMLSSHDTPRLATVLEGDGARVRQAMALQFCYPGIPMIYYGEEIGMRGGADPANRAGMVWDEARWDEPRLELVQRLAGLRQSEPALRHGRYVSLAQPGTDVLAFARVTDHPAETLLFVANGSEDPRQTRLFVPLPWMLDGLPLHDLLDGKTPLRWSQGCLDLALKPHAVMLLKPDDHDASGYRFFK